MHVCELGEIKWHNHGREGILSVERQRGEKERGVVKVQHLVSTRGKPLWTTDWGMQLKKFKKYMEANENENTTVHN